MRLRNIVFAVAIGGGLFVTGAVAQREQHHPEQTEQTQPQATAQGGAMMSGGMMAGRMAMCQQMMSGGMMAQHQETANLVSQLTDSFKALEKETDPAVLRTMLAKHGALLRQLQTKFQQHSKMMQKMMEGMQQHPMASPEGKKQ
jgi:hypothetical protein